MSANPFEDPSGADNDAYNPFEVNDTYAKGDSYDDYDSGGGGKRNAYGDQSSNAYEDQGAAYEQPEDLRAAPPKSSSRARDRDNDELSLEDIERREANLLKKEKDLMKFRDRLNHKKSRVEKAEIIEDNWPCKMYPLAFHDIEGEIPLEYQKDQKQLYMIVLCTFVCFTWNFVCAVVLQITVEGQSSRMLLLALMFTCFGIPGAWMFWYRSLYWALARE